MRAHTRKQAEHDFGHAESGAALGHDIVERQQGFEPAAQRRSLHQANRQHRNAQRMDIPVQNLAAAMAISDQSVPITPLNQPLKKLKIDAKAAYVGRTAAKEEINERK